MELHKSRGMEYPEFKLFMRLTVLGSELLTYFIGTWLLLKLCSKIYLSKVPSVLLFISITLSPPLILVDHGHFQYNCVSLGLALIAFYLFMSVGKEETSGLPDPYYLFGSVFFVLALLYKQMELYHALPVFFYLLGKCLKQKHWSGTFALFVGLGFTVLITMITCLLPFIVPNHEPLFDILNRMFPVNRGLYEDKVGSFWCVVSTVWKFNKTLPLQQQLTMCSLSCVLSFTPAAISLIREPKRAKFLPAVTISSLCFFLFSYHVHEKSILLALVPASFLFTVCPFEIVWFTLVSIVSMVPLMERDGLLLASLGTAGIWLAVCAITQVYMVNPIKSNKTNWYLSIRSILASLSCISGIILSFTLLTNWPQPPEKFPFLYQLLIAVYSCAHYIFFLAYFYYLLFTIDDKANKK